MSARISHLFRLINRDPLSESTREKWDKSVDISCHLDKRRPRQDAGHQFYLKSGLSRRGLDGWTVCHWYAHTMPLYQQLGICPVLERAECKLRLLVYRVHHREAPAVSWNPASRSGPITVLALQGPDRSCRQFFRQNIEELKERKLPAKSEQNIEMFGKIDA